MSSKEIPRSSPHPSSSTAPESQPTPATTNENATLPTPATPGDAAGQTPTIPSAPGAANPIVDKALLQWELVKSRQGRPESALSRNQREALARLQGKKGASNPSMFTSQSSGNTIKKKKKLAKVRRTPPQEANQPGAAAPAEASSSRAATAATARGVPDGSPTPPQTTLPGSYGSMATGYVSPPTKPLTFKPYVPKRPADSDSELADRPSKTTRKKVKTSKSSTPVATPHVATVPLPETAAVGSSAKRKGTGRKKAEPATTTGTKAPPKKGKGQPRAGDPKTTKDPAPAMASGCGDAKPSQIPLPTSSQLDFPAAVRTASVSAAGSRSSHVAEPALPSHAEETADGDWLTTAHLAGASGDDAEVPTDPVSEDWLAGALCEGSNDTPQAFSAPDPASANDDFLAGELSEASDDDTADASTASSTLAGGSPSASASASAVSSRTSASPSGTLLPLGAASTLLEDGLNASDDGHVEMNPSVDGEEDEESTYCSLFGSDDALFS